MGIITANQVESAFNQGIPLYVDRTPELVRLALAALKGALLAHGALYSTPPLVIDDPDSPSNSGKYITLAHGETGLWQDEIGSPDIGIRGINPDYTGDGNRTTVLHVQATGNLPDILEKSAIGQQLERLRLLGQYVSEQYIQPYLLAVAEVYGIDSKEYLDNFGLEGRTMRAILYHALTEDNAGQMPLSTDGAKLPLAIKEHNDKGSFTADAFTTAGGLQYQDSNECWQSPQNSVVAIFPGAGDQHLPEAVSINPVIHRVVHDQNWSTLNPISPDVPAIKRAAFPLFVDSTNEGAKMVIPGSKETHPTYQ